MNLIFLILLFSFGAVALIFFYRALPGSARDIGWKMSGIWSNPGNLHVLLHNNGCMLRGHLVSPGTSAEAGGTLVIKELEVKPLWRWSAGTYVEPGSKEEHAVKLRLKSSTTLSVRFLSEDKTEEWKLIDPM